MIDLEKIASEYKTREEKITRRVVLCGGTGCIASGAEKIFAKIKEEAEKAGIAVAVELQNESGETHLSKSGCQGFCQMGPLVAVFPEKILYCKVKPADAAEIVNETLKDNKTIERLLYKNPNTQQVCVGYDDIPFYARQQRTVLEACGTVDPEDINEYIARGGYAAAKRCWSELKPETVCEEIEASGLRGRGGGGFPTGMKWRFTLASESDKKYVICNADEGDPGAFMDRSVMEGNPHSVIEGMLIAARGVAATEGYVYVRTEYPLAVSRVQKAVDDATAHGILGEDIFGTGKSFKLHVMEGAGAFVCGEETALMRSIEGQRGMPTPKPPFPATKGLFDYPTVINNVETLASVPLIMANGASWYRKVGTEKSPGTKTFALTGHVANTGLIEVPFGSTMREIIFEIGGGVINDAGEMWAGGFKAVQIGGPSGGCLTEEHLDVPLDFDSLQGLGAMVGSGGLVVTNQDTCMIQMAKFFMQFTQNESCGKCVLCREGTRQMLNMLDKIIAGEGTAELVALLTETAEAVKDGSLCGLGKTAPNPVLSVLRHFPEELEAHIEQKRCPAGQCKALLSPEILADKCKGCTLCKKKCPVGAISGEVKELHVIDVDKCVKCGVCAASCKFDAIVGVGA